MSRVEDAQATIAEELSLDFEGSALQRLSSMLEKTSEAVETSLTLDDEASPLAPLRRELLEVLTQHKHANTQFQSEVRSTLETFKTRREEAARTTLHGLAFEDSMGAFISREATRLGDVCDAVGTVRGREQRKLGDYVVALGPESASPGSRVVFEAKAKKRYTLKSALQELEDARKNREAQVGVFVFDRDSAPTSMENHRALQFVLEREMTVETAAQVAVRERGLELDVASVVADVERAQRALRGAGLLDHVCRLEYPIAGALESSALLVGNIDLLVVSPESVSIIDFKTDTPPDADVCVSHASYVAQVRSYGRLLAASGFVRDRELKHGLLFTADGSLHWV